MIIGYSIRSIDPQKEKEFALFLGSKCIFEEGIADNIAKYVANEIPINIYTKGITLNDLIDFGAEASTIEVETGEYAVVSAVNFRLELNIDSTLRVLQPTQYFKTDYNGASSLCLEEKQGLVKIFPSLSGNDLDWILASNLWNDGGIWIDDDVWKD